MVKSIPSSSKVGGTSSGSGSGGTGIPSTFIGFGAFATTTNASVQASPSLTSSSSSSKHHNVTSTGTESDHNNAISNNYTWTPVYMGHDDTFRTLFLRIYQKREPITIVKALQEVQSHIDDLFHKNIHNKKVLVEAMKHYAYLYYHKLSIGSFTTTTSNRTGSGSNGGGMENGATTEENAAKHNVSTTTSISTMMISTSTIRANAVKIWFLFYKFIPKAVMQVCYNHNELLGIIYATQTDPSTEVRNAVPHAPPKDHEEPHFVHPLMLLTNSSNKKVVDDAKWQKCWDDGIIAFTTTRILSYSKPMLMLEALCGHEAISTKTDGQQQQQQQQQRSINVITLNDPQRDAVDELYIRLVGNCLDCIGHWLQLQQQQQSNCRATFSITWELFHIWCKPFLSYGATSNLSSSSKNNRQEPHSVRRKTYQLLTIITTRAPYIFDLLDVAYTPSNSTGAFGNKGVLQKILLQAFSMEMDPVNIPHLLEATLSLLACYNDKYKKNCNVEENYPDPDDFPLVLSKPLIKLFSKACYGAKVEQWGPVMLPLIGGQYRTVQHQFRLLSSLKVGIPLTYGIHEKYQVWIAICETSSFILLRSMNTVLPIPVYASQPTLDTTSKNTDTITEAASNIAGLWIDGFQFCLSAISSLPRQISRSSNSMFNSSTASVTNATEGQHRLLQIISDQLIQYHQATAEKKVCLLANTPNLVNWFWSDGIALTLSETSHLRSIVQLLQELQGQKGSTFVTKRQLLVKLVPILKARFHTSLQEQRASFNSVPCNEMYQYFQSVLNYCGPHEIFDKLEPTSTEDKYEQTSLEQFIMNDLLRWSIIHTSSLEAEQRHESSCIEVQQDFELLSTCLKGLQLETRKIVWNSFLREIILAECDIEFLTVGLSVSIRCQSNSLLDLIPCDELDNYAKDIDKLSKAGSNCLETNEDWDNIYHDGSLETRTQFFFRMCLGIGDESDSVLVSLDVVANWVDYLCSPNTIPKPSQLGFELMISLLESLHRKKIVLIGDQVERLVMSSWHIIDYPCINSLLMDLLNADPILRNNFQVMARNKLNGELHLSVLSSAVSQETERNWAERAWFLFRSGEAEISSFPLLGFECINTWKQNPSVVFSLAMSVLHKVTSISDRLKLVKTWASNDVPTEFIVELLTTISEASSDLSLGTKSIYRNDRSALFLRAIGGKTMDTDFVDGLAHMTINKLSNEIREQGNDESVQPRIAVLSLILELKFHPLQIINSDVVSPEEIMENDILWYISDSNNPQNREEAQVVKVHVDSSSGFYFSILVNRDGKNIERQTVAGRLRKLQYTETEGKGSRADSFKQNDSEMRKEFRRIIWNELLSNYVPEASNHNLGELVHILVTQLGLGDERGIGSVYYEVYQLIKRIEEKITLAIDNKDNDTLIKLIFAISLTFGYGLNAPGSPCLLIQMWTGPIPCVSAIFDFYKECDVGRNNALDAVVTVFLTSVSCIGRNLYDNNIIMMERFLTLLFSLSSSVLMHCQNKTLRMDCKLAHRAILQGILLINTATMKTSTVTNALQAALRISIQSFFNDERVDKPELMQFSEIENVFISCIKRRELRHILSDVCVSNAGALFTCLFIPNKRSIAFSLFELIASRETEYTATNNVAPAIETAVRFKNWTVELNDDDTTMLEEDLYIVSEWVPSCLMIEIEGWDDSGFEMENEPTIVGRLLCWFCLLRFIESAAPRNFRNRPAFISYVEQCGAAYSILNLGLLHNEIVNSQRNIIPVIDEVSKILLQSSQPDVTQLATLSLFRTVEVLPSLCRRWWEDECPRVYASPVQDLVEKFVAPEIFKREIDRIKSLSLFGKMSVSASITKRDVTATYEQDDFNLKVIITLPAAFPFRSAEVDCSKTLGVPQSRWKRWSLQITMMLNNQGGTLQDALMLWKDNVDKEFEGVEPCPVCYSVLHVKTHKLPSLQCKTCQNRFHVECLTEWFRSSGKSQCVLCQQPWQGTRV